MAEAIEKIGMPLEEFIELSNDQPFEIISGERRPRLPTVFGRSDMIRRLFRMLDSFTQTHRLGEVYIETTYILPDANDSDWVVGSRIPDLMFFSDDRVQQYKVRTPDHRQRPLALVPDLAIEVVSPSDKFSELDEKVDAYLLDGVRLIWVLDPQRRKAVVHAPDLDQPLHLKEDGVLDAGDVIPGFKVALSSLLE